MKVWILFESDGSINAVYGSRELAEPWIKAMPKAIEEYEVEFLSKDKTE